MKRALQHIGYTLLLICTVQLGLSQIAISEVSYEAIPFKKVRSYVENQSTYAEGFRFADLKPTCEDQNDYSSFRTYSKRYVVNAALPLVWSTYLSASPTLSWKTNKSAVGLVYDRNLDSLMYSNDTVNGSTIGQMLYLELRLVKGLYHLATALEITNVSNDELVIEISYVEKGVNQGKQWIHMTELGNGQTLVTHTSSIKSDSQFRDRYLYPYFHNKLINAFHRNMRKMVYAGTYQTAISSAL